MEHRIGIKVHHKPMFNFAVGTIKLNNAAMDVNSYLQIKSGSAEIRYPFGILFRRSFPISIKAERIMVVPGTELKKALGDQPIIFDTVSAKLFIQPDREMVVDFIDANSKTLQFHLGAKKSNEA